jgi:hypothetical protein
MRMPLWRLDVTCAPGLSKARINYVWGYELQQSDLHVDKVTCKVPIDVDDIFQT